MTVLSDALNNGKYTPQLDISSAQQYVDLEEELYIRAPLNKTLKQKSNKIKNILTWIETIRSKLVQGNF